MYDFVIIHGSYGSPFENWSPWLFNALTEKGEQVLAPQFPAIDQNYNNWDRVFSAYDQFIGEETSFIAHSLGPAFVLDYLVKYKRQIKNLYLIAPFYGLINIEEFDEVNKTFFIYEDVSVAKPFFKKAFCLFSDNDPYVPISMSKDIAGKLSASTMIVPGGKHLNANAGFTEFSELLKVIEADD
ncbi:MAG: alpha/beta hydrolase [Christensenellaceae bacterium]|jgi:predicted alpha/beta hydrolase family esterase|nr:alpha/beta hydrolase [Christensenellaceae bacterium]